MPRECFHDRRLSLWPPPADETDVGDFQATVNDLTPVSEPLYDVA